MEAITIDLRATTKLNILINEKASFNTVLEHFEDDGTTPQNLPGGNYQMAIYTKNSQDDILLLLNAANGLTVAGSTITISRNAVQNILPPGEYYYDIRYDMPDGTAFYPYEGKITVDKKRTPHI